MDLGLFGLGRMGRSMAERLIRSGHRCVVFNRSPAPVEELVKKGAVGAKSLAELVSALAPPRAVWLMLPAAVVDGILDELVPLLQAGDTVVEGGNSLYHDDLRRVARLRDAGIHYLDVGVSGGVHGGERGYCLMIGGDATAVERLTPIFRALAPGLDAAPRTPGNAGEPAPQEHGFLHCGPSGAGHFVKMVHNGIEYGVMAAYAEGLDILRHANAGNGAQRGDAETAPLRHPEHYRYDFDLPAVAELWRRGSVIGSWLLDLTAHAFKEHPQLDHVQGRVSDSGEGRWTIAAAIDTSVPVPVLSSALYERFSSRGEAAFADRVLSAMRFEFGGHREKKPQEIQP